MRFARMQLVTGMFALIAAAMLSSCALTPTSAAASPLIGSGDIDRAQHAGYVAEWHAWTEHPMAHLVLSARMWSPRYGAVANACGSFTVTFFSADGRTQIESADACTDDSGWATVSIDQPLDASGQVVPAPWSASGLIGGITLRPLQGTAGP